MQPSSAAGGMNGDGLDFRENGFMDHCFTFRKVIVVECRSIQMIFLSSNIQIQVKISLCKFLI